MYLIKHLEGLAGRLVISYDKGGEKRTTINHVTIAKESSDKPIWRTITFFTKRSF